MSQCRLLRVGCWINSETETETEARGPVCSVTRRERAAEKDMLQREQVRALPVKRCLALLEEPCSLLPIDHGERVRRAAVGKAWDPARPLTWWEDPHRARGAARGVNEVHLWQSGTHRENWIFHRCKITKVRCCKVYFSLIYYYDHIRSPIHAGCIAKQLASQLSHRELLFCLLIFMDNNISMLQTGNELLNRSVFKGERDGQGMGFAS